MTEKSVMSVYNMTCELLVTCELLTVTRVPSNSVLVSPKKVHGRCNLRQIRASIVRLKIELIRLNILI